MRFITSLLLAIVARNVQTLLDFITLIDTRLDAYIASQTDAVEAIDGQISDLKSKRYAARNAARTAANLKAGFANLRG